MTLLQRLPRPRTLKTKTRIAVLLVLLLAVGNVLTLQFLLGKSSDLAATLNVAGKMRMLSQRIAVEALATHGFAQPAAGQFEDSYRAFDTAYEALRRGGRAFELQVRPLDAPLQPLLPPLQAGWLEYRQTVDALLAATPPDRAQVARVLAASGQLLERAESLMQQLVAHANQVQQRALWSSMVLFGIDVLVLLAGYALIARRVLRPVYQLTLQCREMGRGNYNMRLQLDSSDELAELAGSMQQSAAQIEQLLCDVARERTSLAQIQAMFNGLADNEVAGIYMLDAQLRIVYANEQLARMFGHPLQAMEHLPLARLFPPADYEAVQASVRERLEGRAHSARYERSAQHADGHTFDIEVFGTTMQFQGQPAIIGLMLDISERRRAEASARRAALVYQHTCEGMVVTDADGVVLDINPAFTAMTGYQAHEIVGQRLNRLSSGRQDRAFYQAMWDSLQKTGSWSGDIVNRRKNGEEFIEQLTISTSYNPDGSVNSRIGLFSDVTQLRRKEATIWHQAHYDHLTQLPNRQMFQDNLRRCVEQSRHSGLPFALAFLDLDFFKEVNDSLGHDAGDELLRQVAQRLQGCVRSTDLVARLGGDEFTLLLQGLKRLEDAHPVCRKVLHAIAQPYALGSATAEVSVSMGLAYGPRDGHDGETLLRRADLAMYAAKEQGRNQFCEFTPELERQAQGRRLQQEQDSQALPQQGQGG